MDNALQSQNAKPIIAITCGDVAGIGPEVVARAIADGALKSACFPLVVGHPGILERACLLANQRLVIRTLRKPPDSDSSFRRTIADAASQGTVLCWNPGDDSVLRTPPRQVSAAAGHAAYLYLIEAIRLARSGIIDAIATAPLNKESLYLGGHPFPGHTEILAEECGVTEFAMMLYLPESRLAPLRMLIKGSDSSRSTATGSTDAGSTGSIPPSTPPSLLSGLSIAHVTLHTSVASVPKMLTVEGVVEKTRLVDQFLIQIGCQRRAIAVCALNPHGGENGLFGGEEKQIIEPAVVAAGNQGVNATGPLPADTLIRRAVSGEFDGVVAMYHDQGHIPVKLIGFDAAVNITLGLPIIRTSPTHGTAFDRAWKAETPADAAGMLEAILMAARLCTRQSQQTPSR